MRQINAPASVGGGGGGGATIDREMVVTTYRVKTAFSGASVGDTITGTRVLDVTGTDPVQTGSTAWFNESTNTALGSVPSASNLELVAQNAITDAQLRAAGLPLPIGAATEATLATLAGKIPASPSTAGNQAAANNTLSAIQALLASSSTDPATPDSAPGLLTREMREENAFSQMLLENIATLLLKVFTMTAAGGNPSFSVAQAVAANLQATVTATNLSCNLSQVNAVVLALTAGIPAMFSTQMVPVALGQNAPLPILPGHIYNGFTV